MSKPFDREEFIRYATEVMNPERVRNGLDEASAAEIVELADVMENFWKRWRRAEVVAAAGTEGA